jgi:AcrR family transcriptional regulator
MVDRRTVETGAGGWDPSAADSSAANPGPRSPDSGGQEGAGGQDSFADDMSDGLSGEDTIQRLLVGELGEELAGAFELARQAQERWARRRRPGEGLRERKKRHTRQQISDVATALFVVRGFDHVKVAEIAEVVGVSEKTVYNYFPTKESLVFDRADEGIARLATALRERDVGESPARSVLRALGEDLDELEELPDEVNMFMPVFAEMVASTPALRAAWLDLQGRLVAVATEELAARADVDPRDPEPLIAARAIAGLLEVAYESRVRHIEAGLRGGELRDAVLADLERAARLLDTGLWSFNLLAQGARTRAQLREAASAAEDVRAQVVDALEQARAAWRELRGSERAAANQGERSEAKRKRAEVKRESSEIKRAAKQAVSQRTADERREAKQAVKQAAKEAAKQAAKEAARQSTAAVRREAKRTASQVGEAAWKNARDRKKSLREAHALAERAAYLAFRQALGERQEAVRERQAATITTRFPKKKKEGTADGA